MDLAPLLAVAPGPFREAAFAAYAADRLGTAFLAGYRAAVARLSPAWIAPDGTTLPAALLVTERFRPHPRAVETRLRPADPVAGPSAGYALSGVKRFATGVPGAVRFVVLAADPTAGEVPAGTAADAGRLALVAAIVDADAPGVSVLPLPPLPFCPEVPHAEVRFDGAPVRALLPGDGWADVVKPFRTVEDAHVLGAALAYLLGASARHPQTPEVRIALAGALAAFAALAAADPGAPSVHLALAGVLDPARAAIRAFRWAPGEEADRFARDLPLLDIAEAARAQRLRKALDGAARS